MYDYPQSLNMDCTESNQNPKPEMSAFDKMMMEMCPKDDTSEDEDEDDKDNHYQDIYKPPISDEMEKMIQECELNRALNPNKIEDRIGLSKEEYDLITRIFPDCCCPCCFGDMDVINRIIGREYYCGRCFCCSDDF